MPECLRAATPADLPGIAALGRWVWLNSYASEGVSASFARHVDEAFALETLQASLQRESQWVIVEGEFLQAWAELDSRVEGKVELVRLYVAPPCTGRGLGARLLQHARAAYPDRTLWLSVWEDNQGARRFYRREGAQVLGDTWFELDGQRHRNEVLGWPALEDPQ